MNPTTVLVTTSGRDRPGVTAALFAALAAHDVEVLDVEQVVIRGRLIAGILLAVHGDPAPLRHSIGQTASALGMEYEVVLVEDSRPGEPVADPAGLLQVLVLGRWLRPGAVAAVCQRIADVGGNILTVSQASQEPVASLELTVDGDHAALRDALAMAAPASGLDIAMQRAGLARRAKRLVMIDFDAMLLQGNCIEELAARAGTTEEVAAIATSGQLSPAEKIAAQVRALAGLPLAEVWQIRDSLRLAPGVRPLIHTLKRLGYAVGVVSGGFTVLIDQLVAELGLDFAAANVLAVRDGGLTGDLVGQPLDPAGKAAALRRFAAGLGVPLTQTVAIGDGAGDTALLRLASLGIAFNAKAVREPSGATVSPPFLDAVLHVLGISRTELAAADLKQA